VPALDQGRIIWVEVADPQGKHKKLRPAVVVSATADVQPEETLVAVAATTSAGDQPSPERIELPRDPAGRARTGLRRQTFAVCNRILEVRLDDIKAYAGVVPPRVLVEIIKRLPQT
jgi:hypothetical protein